MPIDRVGIILDAASGFCLVISYNPGHQSVLKDLKESTSYGLVNLRDGMSPTKAAAAIND